MASKPTKFDPLFQEVGSKYGVDPAILKAIASVESNFRPDAVGPRTRSGRAQGMMQFVPATAKAYGLDDPFDPAKSVDAAARLMRDNLKQFNGDVGKALEAYNGGPRLVGKSRQTAAYREKVMQRAQLARKDPKFKTQLAKTQSLPPMAGKSAPTSRQEMPDTSALPASYKAALALQYFTDTDPEGNPVENAQEELERLLEEEQYAQSAPAGGAMLAKALAPQKETEVSPFDIMAGMQQPESVDQEPTRMAQVQGFADGGFVFGGTSLPGAPNWYLDPAADYTANERRVMKQSNQLLSGYNEAIKRYQADVDQYNKLLDKYQKEAEAYNKEVEAWNAGPRTSDFRPTVRNPGEFNVKFEAQEPKLPFNTDSYNAFIEKRNAEIAEARKRVEKVAPGRQLAMDVIQDPGKYNLSGFGFKNGGDVDKRSMMEKVGQWLQDNGITPSDFLYLTGRGIPLGMLLQPSEVNAGEDEFLRQMRESNQDIDNRMKQFDSQIMPDLGKPVGRSKGSGPNAEQVQVPLLDEQGRVLRDPQTKEEFSLLEKIKGAGEAGLSVLSSLVSGPAGAAYGAFKGLTSDKYGTQAGVREAEAAAADVMKAGTYVPRGKVAPEYLQNIGQFLQNYKLDAALPETYAASAALRPGAVGQGIRMPVEQASTAMVRKITGNEALQPTDVYRAMADTKGIASLGAPAATRPGGGDTWMPINYRGKDFAEKYILDPDRAPDSDPEVSAKYEYLNLPFQEKAQFYYANQMGTPGDPLYKAFREGQYDLTPLFRERLSDTETDRTAAKIQGLRDAEAKLLAEPRTPENVAKLSQVERKLTEYYDYFTPTEVNIGKDAIGARLDDDAYRTDIAYRLAEEVGQRVDNMSHQEIINAIDGELQRVGNFVKNEKAGYGGEVDRALSLAFDPTSKTRIRMFTANDLKAVLRQQLLDELDGKVAAQGGMLTREPEIDIGTNLVSEQAEMRGQPTFRPGNAKNPPVLQDELYNYLKYTPLKDIQNRTFAELVLAARKSDTYKYIKDPVEIAKRADQYLALTPDQRFMGTKLADMDGNEQARNALLSSMKASPIKGAQWREITDPGGVKIEGRLLRHCLSRYPEETNEYEAKLTNGSSRYFALRDKKGVSYATIEVERYGMNGPFSVIKQIKGRGNQPISGPDKYGNEVTAFLKAYEQTQPRPLTFTEFKKYVPAEYEDRAADSKNAFGIPEPEEFGDGPE